MASGSRTTRGGLLKREDLSHMDYHLKDEEEAVDLYGVSEPPESTGPIAASFSGRLDIASFAYTDENATENGVASPTRRRRLVTRAVAELSSPSLKRRRVVSNSQTPSTTSPNSGSTTPTRSQPSRRSKPLSGQATPTEGSTPARSQPARTQQSRSRSTTSSTASSTTPERPSPRKRARKPSGYAPPSTYAHLNPLVDILAPNLLTVFVGLNPGLQTAAQGHAYAHPSNHFWKLLFTSGCTTRRMHHTEDRSLPELYSFGITNIVARPSRNNAELTKTEMDQRVPILEAKVRKWKPESVTIVGKSIWESIWRARYGRNIRKHEFKYGWQDECENMGMMSDAQFDAIELDGGDRGGAPEVEVPGWKGAKVFVASTTSGAAAIPTPAEKQAIWRELGVWVEERRRERSRAVKKESVEVVEAGPASDDLPRRGSVTPCKCCIFSEGGCRWT